MLVWIDGLFLIQSATFLVVGMMSDFFFLLKSGHSEYCGTLDLTPSISAATLWYHSSRGTGRRLVSPGWRESSSPPHLQWHLRKGCPLPAGQGDVGRSTNAFLAGRSGGTASSWPTQWSGGVEMQTPPMVSTHVGWRWQVLSLPSRNQSPGSPPSLLGPHPVQGLGAWTQPGRSGSLGFPSAFAGRWDHRYFRDAWLEDSNCCLNVLCLAGCPFSGPVVRGDRLLF